jgi:hypothetical protein
MIQRMVAMARSYPAPVGRILFPARRVAVAPRIVTVGRFATVEEAQVATDEVWTSR